MARPKAKRSEAQATAPLDPIERDRRLNLALAGGADRADWVGRLELLSDKLAGKLNGLEPDLQAAAVPRLAERIGEHNRTLATVYAEHRGNPHRDVRWDDTLNRWRCLVGTLQEVVKRRPPLTDEDFVALLGVIDLSWTWYFGLIPVAPIAAAVEHRAKRGPLGERLMAAAGSAAGRIRAYASGTKLASEAADALKAADRLAKAAGETPAARIEPGEAWSDAALTDLAAMDDRARAAWSALLASCQAAGAGKPTAGWMKEIRTLVEAVGHVDFRQKLTRWFPLVDRPRTRPKPREHAWGPSSDDLLVLEHVHLLRGLAWAAGLAADSDLARALAALALSAYRKVSGKGPRHIALGSAAIAALGAMPGMDTVGQLALLKLKIKFLPAQKEVEKALTAAAEREGLPRDEVDELAVPAYGMEEVGHRREVLGDYVAELVVEGQDAAIRWSKADDGKSLKSAPAAAKKDHAEEVKELQAAVKDVGKMLTAQRERIDGLFLARKRWPLDAWRSRYLDHPLVGVIARRLVWGFETDGKLTDGIWLDGQLVGADDRPLEGLGEGTTVTLWHPIGRAIDEITSWRDWLDRHQIRQPFKQAHREVYVLTDAERATRVYSNRFAAHVLRQHQYHALCASRGWRNKLRMMVDDSYPPTSKDLPEWGLRAEFWVEGIEGNYGEATTESGAYLHLATDQVRFYEIGAAQRHAHAGGGGYSADWRGGDAEPVPLDRVPALVLSEVLRDVDLFVGVASVGNDPNWSDGGPDGRHIDYWQSYSFGDLTANGQTRKAVLERLIPRLKIAPRCSFSDKFLVVRGDLRTYKIHLGSGNILMEPNDQYLCIVPKRSAAEPAAGSGVFLPFEGDNTLSIVLSKALLLAEDTKITDPTIVSQIRR